MQKYDLISVVWELTMGCNMRCGHCGSSCKEKLPDELTTDEALSVCDELADLGLKYITLSGGEPTTRPDWHLIAKKLTDRGIKTSMITNGWMLDDDMIAKAKMANLNTLAISIDGLKETHDFMRKSGSFDKDMVSLAKIKENGLNTGVITTLNKRNIKELEALHKIFTELDVGVWQLQIAMPMGNFKEHTELYLEPHHVNDIIDFAYDRIGKGVKIAFADCIGYYNKKAMAVSENYIPNSVYWQGCAAGKSTLGVLHNGDIVPCTSVRSKDLIVGNVRNRKLADIWNDPESFAWNRNFKKEQLKGLCQKCQYGSICLGGCNNSRLCMNDSFYSENKYCSYHVEISKFEQQADEYVQHENLDDEILDFINKGYYQFAEILLNRVLTNKATLKYLHWYGFVNYKLENYSLCIDTNKKILELSPKNSYATKGLGLALFRVGNTDEALSYLYQAAEFNNCKDADIYFDLFAVLKSLNKADEMEQVLTDAKKCSNYNDFEAKFNEVLQS